MTIYCISDYGNGVLSGAVCDGRVASEIGDEEFVTYHDADGVVCQIRQRGMAVIASNPTDALTDSTIDQSLLRAVQNATEFELKECSQILDGRFLCLQPQFIEHQQSCQLELTTALIGEFPTFVRALEEMRCFEAMIHGLDSDPGKFNPKVARLSDDLAARATNLRLWEGLFIPACFRYHDIDIYGIVETRDLSENKAIVRWVNGPAKLASGTEILCPSESDSSWRFAVVV